MPRAHIEGVKPEEQESDHLPDHNSSQQTAENRSSRATFSEPCHKLDTTVFPRAQYDGYDRDAAHPRLWRTPGRNDFGMANLPLYVVSHNNARLRIAQSFPYENSPIPSINTPRWHFNIFQGWWF